MKCQTTNNLLQDFIDERLSDLDRKIVADHLEECAFCREKYQLTLTVIAMLKDMPVPPASPEFATRAIKQATGNGIPPRSKRLPYIGSAIAASFIAIFILVTALIGTDPANHEPTILLIGEEVQTIKVAIESAHSVDSIRMTIDLTDNLEISGYQNQKVISWNTSLEKGTNIIALPVSAIARGDGEITTRVGLRDREKVFKIKTRYQSPEKVGREYQVLASLHRAPNNGIML